MEGPQNPENADGVLQQARHEGMMEGLGARCVGATLAIFLAQAGLRVLLLDRTSLHSDTTLSTYTIHPPGIDVLDEVGVGQALRAVTPPTHTIRMNRNGTAVDLRHSDGRATYSPRQTLLDGLLQDAAISAGAALLLLISRPGVEDVVSELPV